MKTQLSEIDSTNSQTNNKFIWEGEVIDELNGDENGILKIRIPEIDNNVPDSELPLCYPLTSFSFFKVLPKKGERVTLIFRTEQLNKNINKDIRYWISIVHSPSNSNEFQPFFGESNEHYPDSNSKNKNKKIINFDDKNGDVTIIGRTDSKITLRDQTLRLIAGFNVDNIFNKKNPSFIHLNTASKNNSQIVNTQNEELVISSPKIDIIIQIENNVGSIYIKNIGNDTIIESKKITNNSREDLIVLLKEDILLFEAKYPYWQLINSVPELNSLPTTFSSEYKNSNTLSLIDDNNFSNIVVNSDKIFLISNLNTNVNLKQEPNYYSNEQLANIVDIGEPLPYGNKLVELIELMRIVILTHTHPYHGMESTRDDVMQKLINFDLSSILNKNILTY